ncbi:hypothetical protein [Proteus vulgaris]|uniref:hypothetical protein n=1 Tax=Proteus vulgaris TaxID=585 RepID=UPI0011473FEE|nr:hypothetical protein [Proteus vulgaris]
MSNSKPTRWLKPKECLDGSQEWRSITHATNIGAEIHAKPHLPGIIIFVHGVNSEGGGMTMLNENCAKDLMKD